MSKFAKWSIVIGVVMISLAGLPGAKVQAWGLDIWRLPQLKQELAENQRKQEELECESRIVSQRIAVKDQLVRELISGKSSLAETTDKFAVLNNDAPEIIEHLRENFRVSDERELSALNVIAFAESYLDANEPDAPKILERLDREFDAMFPNEKISFPRKP